MRSNPAVKNIMPKISIPIAIRTSITLLGTPKMNKINPIKTGIITPTIQEIPPAIIRIKIPSR